jgi:hypothetical protein
VYAPVLAKDSKQFPLEEGVAIGFDPVHEKGSATIDRSTPRERGRNSRCMKRQVASEEALASLWTASHRLFMHRSKCVLKNGGAQC